MEDLQKKIAEAAIKYSHSERGKPLDWEYLELSGHDLDGIMQKAFYVGANSHEAKEYWKNQFQQNNDLYLTLKLKEMFTKEDVNKIVRYTIGQWISHNERMEPDHEDLVNNFIINVLPDWINNKTDKF